IGGVDLTFEAEARAANAGLHREVVLHLLARGADLVQRVRISDRLRPDVLRNGVSGLAEGHRRVFSFSLLENSLCCGAFVIALCDVETETQSVCARNSVHTRLLSFSFRGPVGSMRRWTDEDFVFSTRDDF